MVHLLRGLSEAAEERPDAWRFSSADPPAHRCYTAIARPEDAERVR